MPKVWDNWLCWKWLLKRTQWSQSAGGSLTLWSHGCLIHWEGFQVELNSQAIGVQIIELIFTFLIRGCDAIEIYHQSLYWEGSSGIRCLKSILQRVWQRARKGWELLPKPSRIAGRMLAHRNIKIRVCSIWTSQSKCWLSRVLYLCSYKEWAILWQLICPCRWMLRT